MKNRQLTTELFKIFTESVLNEHKNNKNLYDTCIDIYSKTALFDFSNIYQSELNFKQYFMLYSKDKSYKIDNFQPSLICESMFIKLNETTSLFLRDYKYNIITGCYVKKLNDNNILKLPINIVISFLLNNTVININAINSELQSQLKQYENELQYLFCDVENTLNIIHKLNTKVVLYDEPIENKASYYRYKNKSKGTLKVPARPIYIILDKEKHIKKNNYSYIHKQGKITYNFSFSVIGHWRKLSDENKIGKDKHGNYNIKGYTWVKSFIKGDKNLKLINKERILL